MHLIYGSHERGIGIYNIENNVFILSVPRVASDTLRYIANNSDIWIHENVFNVVDEVSTIVVMLRDPYDRFLSALNMRIFTKNHNTFFINQLFDKCDLHFLNQYAYMDHVQRTLSNKIAYFYFNDAVFAEIAEVYNLNELVDAPRLNTSKKFIYHVDKHKIKEMYKQDYNLIHSVNFKNRGPQ